MKVAVLGKVDQKGLSFLKENEFKFIEIENFETQNLKEQLKDVDGILYPFKTEIINGMQTITIEFEEIKFNESFAESDFN